MENFGLAPPKWVSRVGIWPHGQRNAIVKWFNDLYRSLPLTRTYRVTGTWASVGAGTTSEQSVAVTGLTADDLPLVVKPTHQPGLGIVGARCETDTLLITFMNTSGGAIVPASEQYLVAAIRV